MKEFFTDPQLDKLSDILISIAQVLLASIAVPAFFHLDKVDPDIVPSGSTLMFGSWILSLLVIKGVKK